MYRIKQVLSHCNLLIGNMLRRVTLRWAKNRNECIGLRDVIPLFLNECVNTYLNSILFK
jgi:hypothetical protein